jgi:hypothetical protein
MRLDENTTKTHVSLTPSDRCQYSSCTSIAEGPRVAVLVGLIDGAMLTT